MATGINSKEGLFDLLFAELKKQGMEGKYAHTLCVEVIDDIIPEQIQEDKALLKSYLLKVGLAISSAALKL